MAGYKPLKITGMQTGLVQSREEFILPNDAYPILENAFVWRERIKRKQGYELLGRLRRILTAQNLGNTDGVGNFTGNIRTILGLAANEPNSSIQCGSVSITVGAQVFTDPNGDGILVGGGGGTINYSTMVVTLATAPALPFTPVIATFNYYPSLPVMGIRTRELNTVNNEQTICFDTIYAYRFGATGWEEFIPGTTWTGTDFDFFWTTNYWVDSASTTVQPRKVFWVTNDSGTAGDPIRISNGVAWANFAPGINGTTTVAASLFLHQCVAMLPFRGRMLAFNTLEGALLANSVNYPQRIRWCQIGTPFDVVNAVVSSGIDLLSWSDAVRGKGGYLDIPTSEQIVSVGFVRDNLVIYCERSTWQLRYTGRSISPFQIEKVNTELGAESTFSAVQFDTSLVGIGDKGIVECDSFQSNRIDIKIPDLVFQFNNQQEGTRRVHGIRDFVQRLAFWTYPYIPGSNVPVKFPNRRLVYNYENDSWAIFTDSLTTLGNFQPTEGRTWSFTQFPWLSQNYPWINRPTLIPQIVGGNQQGYVLYLDQQTTNDISLTIKNITGNTTTPTVIESPDHNLVSDQVVTIQNIPTGTPFANLNGQHFGINRLDANNFELWLYNPVTRDFDLPLLDPPGVYVGCGNLAVRDGFRVISKKFNMLDQGQNIQLGHVDVLLADTTEGAISMYAYVNYNDDAPVNILPQNNTSDDFFNSVVPTTNPGLLDGSKNWQRVYCPLAGTFITIEWTLSNGQLVGPEQASEVQIDAQILWIRGAGKQIPASIV